MEEDDIPTFAKRLKEKFPEYADVDDVELVERTIRKHPVYASQVKLPSDFSLLNTTTGYKNLDAVYEQAGRENNVDPNLLLEQGRQETINFKPDVIYGRLNSPKGAQGAGQFMPGTAPQYGVTDRTDPVQSIHGQAKYMRKLLDQFDGNEDLALAGYNSGEYRKSLAQGQIPQIKETQDYVKTIGGNVAKVRAKGLTLANYYQPDDKGGQSVTPTVPQTQTQPTSTPDESGDNSLTQLPGQAFGDVGKTPVNPTVLGGGVLKSPDQIDPTTPSEPVEKKPFTLKMSDGQSLVEAPPDTPAEGGKKFLAPDGSTVDASQVPGAKALAPNEKRLVNPKTGKTFVATETAKKDMPGGSQSVSYQVKEESPDGTRKAIPGGLARKTVKAAEATVDGPQLKGTHSEVRILDDAPTVNPQTQEFTRRVTFEDKPEGVENKEWFIQHMVPQLASEYQGVSADDIEKTLRDRLHDDPVAGKATPLNEIKKDQFYDFVSTPDFYQAALKRHEDRIAHGSRILQEAIVTGKDLTEGQNEAKSAGLSAEDIAGIASDPTFVESTAKTKKAYEGMLDFYRSVGTEHPEILARRAVHFLDEKSATAEIKQDFAEKNAYNDWLKKTGFDDPKYRADHSQEFEKEKQNALAQGGFASLQKQKQDVDTYYADKPWLKIASYLPSLMGNETLAKDTAIRRTYGKTNRLSDVEINNAKAFGEGVKNYLNVWGNPASSAGTGAGLGLGADALNLASGTLRIAAPVLDWATGGNASNWLDRAAEQTRLAGEKGIPDRPDNALAFESGVGAGQAPGLIGTTVLAGGNPVLGFALHSALTNTGKPLEQQTTAVINDAVMGGVFESLPILRGLGGKVLDDVLTKIGFDAAAKDELGAMTAKARTAKVIDTLFEKGKRIGMVASIGSAQAATQDVAGETSQQKQDRVLKAGVLYAVQELGMGAFGKEPTEADLSKLDGKVIRVPDENGNPVDLVFKDGEVAETKAPDEVLQAVIAPKDAAKAVVDSSGDEVRKRLAKPNVKPNEANPVEPHTYTLADTEIVAPKDTAFAKKGDKVNDVDHIAAELKPGDQVTFFVERERTGTWDGKYVREDGTGNPWGLFGILNQKDGWLRNEGQADETSKPVATETADSPDPGIITHVDGRRFKVLEDRGKMLKVEDERGHIMLMPDRKFDDIEQYRQNASSAESPDTSTNQLVPERDVTLKAQRKAMLSDAQGSAIGVLYTDPKDAPALVKGTSRFALPDGELHINNAKFEAKYGKKPSRLTREIESGRIAVEDLIGGKAVSTKDTTTGTALVTTDAEGNELNASKVDNEAAAQEQIKLDKERFGDAAAGHQLVDAEEVKQSRIEDRPIVTSDQEAADTKAPDADATDGDATAAPAESATAAAHDAATSPQNDLPEPTQAQKEAGNYKKGHISINGLDISVENPVGSSRSGVDRDGKAWSNEMSHHYGYIKRTVGADEEHIDVFVKDHTPADFAGKVYVVDQIHPDNGKFDEHKVMLGYESFKEATDAYDANYAKDWKGGKHITEMPFDEFKKWVREGRQSEPISKDLRVEPIENSKTDPETKITPEKTAAKDDELKQEEGSPQERIKRLVDLPPSASQENAKEIVRPLNDQDVQRIKTDAGIDVSTDHVFTIDKSAINHIRNRHGLNNEEMLRGQVPVTAEDIQKIPEILESPDFVTTDGKSKKGLETVVFGKRFNGHTIVVDEVRTGAKELAVASMRKYKGGSEFLPKTEPPTPEATLPNGSDPLPKPKVSTPEAALPAQSSTGPERTVTHPNPAIDDKPILAETPDGVIGENAENKGGVSVVKDRPVIGKGVMGGENGNGVATIPTPAEPSGGKRSKVGIDIEAKAIADDLSKGFEGTAEYDPITFKEQGEKVAGLIADDPERARAIVRGSERLPNDIRGAAFITGMERQARSTNDVELLRDLSKSPLVSETSRHAQELALLRERMPNSPVKLMKDIQAARETAAKRRSKKMTVEQVVQGIKDEVRRTTAKRPKDWSAFIETLKC